MLSDEFINNYFEDRVYSLEDKIYNQYYEQVKKIQVSNEIEKMYIKMSILSKLYYKEGFKDGIDYAINIQNKNNKNKK